jgi:hypothetical protein
MNNTVKTFGTGRLMTPYSLNIRLNGNRVTEVL